ncbi:MAG: hypothetical protein FWG89_04430 [Treponema sp.]|nr:hypothetical protein [Treponema sp.]
MSKKPRFFCDNCNTEVDRNTKACPQCGRFFSSIRCPSCGHSGEEKTFLGGCPSCGYSAPKTGDYRLPEKKVPAGPLPLWVYVFSICAFIAVIAILMYILGR